MADDKVTIGGALTYAWALWSGHWRAIWPALALNSLAAAASSTAVLADNRPLAAGAALIGLVTQIVVAGAVYRIAFADLHRDDPAFARNPSGVHWRAAEWRLLAASLLRGVFMLLIGSLVAVAVLAVTFGLASAQGVRITGEIPAEAVQEQMGPAAMAVLTACLLGAIAALVLVQLRLALVLPATIDRQKINVLSSWPLTRGLALQLLCVLAAIWIPLTASSLLVSNTLLAALGAAPGSMPAGGALAAAVVIGVLFGGVGYPMTDAALAYFYRGARERAP